MSIQSLRGMVGAGRPEGSRAQMRSAVATAMLGSYKTLNKPTTLFLRCASEAGVGVALKTARSLLRLFVFDFFVLSSRERVNLKILSSGVFCLDIAQIIPSR
ncbi:MAG: hypothetical protein AAF986_11730, partial [Pseudomonadota bacterium]